MHTFTQKLTSAQQSKSHGAMVNHGTFLRQNHAVRSILHSQHPAIQPKPEINNKKSEGSVDMILSRTEPETTIPITPLKEGKPSLSKRGHSGAFQGEFTRGNEGDSVLSRMWGGLKSAIATLTCLRNVYPIGVDSTSHAGKLQYGTRFTHQLKITGGPAYCLYGSEVSEDVAIDRDDFKFQLLWKQGFGPIPLGTVIWPLGLHPASPLPDRFIDKIETPENRVLQAMEKPKRPIPLPAIRKETQKFYWRRNRNAKWSWFATIKITFQVVKYRNKLSVWTTVNSDKLDEKWAYRRPVGY